MDERPFRFGLNVTQQIASRHAFQELARQAEGDGWSTLLVPDHLGTTSAFASLVSAADATTSLRLGTLVMNNDFASPLRLAQEASTVDLLTDGRLELGLGSGWAKREYDLLGVAYNPARRRAERLQNAVTVMKSAWSGGQVLSAADGSIPAVPPPTQSPHPPLLIGGQGDSILAAAAREADIVGFTGYTWNGSTLAPTGLSSETLTDRIRFVRDAAGSRFQNLELNVLLRAVRTSSRRRDGKESVAKELGIPTSDVAASPFVLAGTVDDVVEKLLGVRECLGVSYFVAFQTELDELTPVIDALAGR